MSDKKKKGSPKSSANLTLGIGAFKTSLKLMRTRRQADAPEPILTHTCRGELTALEQCPDQHKPTRVASVQNTGNAAGKPATEPRDKICPVCLKKHENGYETALTCATCNVVVAEADVVTRLSYGDRTVAVTAEELEAWKNLLPEPGVMLPVSLTPANTVWSVFRDEAYQLVPEKGSVRGFALWLALLETRRLALIVRFLIGGNPYVGMVYSSSIRGESRLLLSTLYLEEEIAIEDFDVPPHDPAHLAQLALLTKPLGQVPYLDALVDPQVTAFRALYEKGEADGLAQLKLISAVPFEDAALAAALEASVNPPPLPKAKKDKKAKADASAPATP